MLFGGTQAKLDPASRSLARIYCVVASDMAGRTALRWNGVLLYTLSGTQLGGRHNGDLEVENSVSHAHPWLLDPGASGYAETLDVVLRCFRNSCLVGNFAHLP